tara:strand:+ start:8352 stop:8816 length:465 start_codon:yes stop_codon:yes gene_type:complete
MKFKRFDSSETRRFIKFSIVGAIGFIIDTGALNIMIGYLGMTTSLLRLIAKTISFTLALTSNFFWNRYWIYPDSRSKSVRLQAVQFTVVNLIGLALNLLIFGSVSSAFIPTLQNYYGVQAGLILGTNVGQVAAVAVVLFWNFFANRYWTYGDVE